MLHWSIFRTFSIQCWMGGRFLNNVFLLLGDFCLWLKCSVSNSYEVVWNDYRRLLCDIISKSKVENTSEIVNVSNSQSLNPLRQNVSKANTQAFIRSWYNKWKIGKKWPIFAAISISCVMWWKGAVWKWKSKGIEKKNYTEYKAA